MRQVRRKGFAILVGLAIGGVFPNPIARAQEDPDEANRASVFHFENSLQTGIEYDSNVYKAFGGSAGDWLSRTLLKSRGQYSPSPPFKLSWDYQGGGKAYFDEGAQSALIQFAEFPLSWQPHPRFELSLTPDFKLQEERNEIDASGYDVNEDYLSTTARLDLRFFLPSAVVFEPSAGFTYFRFDPTENYSYYREWGGLTVTKNVGSLLGFGAQYAFSRQQFSSADREDSQHQASAFFQYLRAPFFSVRYTFERTDSSQEVFSSDNHRITLIASMPILPRADAEALGHGNGTTPALFALHLLGTLQFRNYPSVFAYDVEGQRYLLTGAEDDNFNSFVAKISYHPFASWAFEAKYTRYSNALSSEQSPFGRSLYYGGARFSF